MPDQTPPPAPEGCDALHGPWWDAQIELWFYLDKFGQVFYRSGSSWVPKDTNECARELLRVAAERDELRKQLADEEGRAVLELIQNYGYWICSEKESDSTGDHQHWVKVSHVFANDPDFVRINPVEELAKVKEKLG